MWNRPLFALIVTLACTACGLKKPAEPVAPATGWFTEEGWSGSCYAPPDFARLEAEEGIAARKMKRSDVMEAMLSQWRGERDDGVSFFSQVTQDAETVLLGHPGDIESVSTDNLAHCRKAMANTGNPEAPTPPSTGDWSAWVAALPEVLTEGECLNPLIYTLFDYLDLGAPFHLVVSLCAEDVALVTATESDQYRIEDNGPWINAGGDPDRPTHTEAEFPCNTEGCFAGMLMGRFTGSSGMEKLFPIGLQTTFRAPEDGALAIGINDSTFYDNAWYKSGGIIHHTGIEVSPAK